ncbi:hypothetical protein H4696_009789 [Amycolatopsis lexingtonensis]|uniref:Uncharacterized protein n=1 Tax=Amycolatopsis lexingtonensis TaxID=218822 RepID=A0ABR9IHM8_9PSEU|nr:hypothetical protein [Amycolatopsis lexingtonensis]
MNCIICDEDDQENCAKRNPDKWREILTND